MLLLTKIFPLLLLICSARASALSFYGNIGYGIGGTQLADSTGSQDYRIQAGTGYFLGGGLLLPISPTTPHRFEAQVGLNLLMTGSDGDNGVTWTRIPLEALYFYRNTNENFRFGYGLTYHVANRVSASGLNSTAEMNVDNAVGWIFSAEKIFATRTEDSGAIGIRYVDINYRSSSFTKDAKGSAWFLVLSFFGG